MKRFLIFLGVFVFAVWILMFAWAFSVFLVSKENYDLIGKLGTFGDAMNVVTSICTMVTVLLVAYGIHSQKEEFKAIKYHAEKQESINRAVKLMEEWQDASVSDVDSKMCDISGLCVNEKKFIDRLIILRKINGNDVVDFNLLIEFIKNDDIDIRLKEERESIVGFLDRLNRQRCDLIDFQESKLGCGVEKESDFDMEEMIRLLNVIDEDEKFRRQVENINGEISRCEYKIKEIEKILGFLKC